MDIENGLCVAECKRFSEEGLACPSNLAKGDFTTSAYDNLDHNPIAITSTESFHGTAISMLQHPSVENKIEQRQNLYLPSKDSLSSSWRLPDFYEKQRYTHSY